MRNGPRLTAALAPSSHIATIPKVPLNGEVRRRNIHPQSDPPGPVTQPSSGRAVERSSRRVVTRAELEGGEQDWQETSEKGLQPNKRSATEIRADAQIQGCLGGGVKDQKTSAECCGAGGAGGAGTEEMLVYPVGRGSQLGRLHTATSATLRGPRWRGGY